MRRSLLSLLAVLALSACAKPVPLAVNSMLPSEVVYEQTSRHFYLNHKISVGTFAYGGENTAYGEVTFQNFGAALHSALQKGGYLAKGSHARYRLTGEIKEVKVPRCLFGSCESGAAIAYTLTDTRSGKVVYDDLLVVPYTCEAPVFMNDPKVQQQVIMNAYTQTVGANIAQLIQVLNRKTASDLK